MRFLQMDEGSGVADGGGIVRALAELLNNFGIPLTYAETIAAVIVFVASFALLFVVGRAVVVPLVERMLDARDVDPHAKRPLMKLTTFTVLFAAVAAAFGFAELGNFLTALATIAAAATLAIGLAMQDVIRNFVAGVFIFTDRPFRIGDWIEWEDGAYKGTVEDISLRVTRVRTFDNALLTVPNSELSDNVVKNPVEADTLRDRFLFGIGYDDDIREATDIILSEAEQHPDILNNPGTSVRLTELADSYVGLESRFWIADPARADVVRIRGEYVEAVKERFDDAGIDIPYPYQELTGGIEITASDRSESRP